MKDVLEIYIEEAAREGVELKAIMMSPDMREDFQRNGDDCSSGSLRGLPVEVHDEWSWGWALRKGGAGETFEIPLDRMVELHKQHGNIPAV